jgi:hypothetical protein
MRNGKHLLLLTGFVAIVGGNTGCTGLVHASRSAGAKHDPAPYTKSVGGFKVQLVAIEDGLPSGQTRMADHSWTPDGFPFEGPEARLAMRLFRGKANAGTSLGFVFEIEPQKLEDKNPQPSTNLDAIVYLPNSAASRDDSSENPSVAGPTAVDIYRGIPKDSQGTVILPSPSGVVFGLGGDDSATQPVAFGIAKGDWHVTVSGPASMAGVGEEQTAVVAKGPWGRIEATRLPRPMIETKPSPTHRFRLLGGQFPPKSERKVFLYDSKGVQIGTCGDGPNNPGYAGRTFIRSGAPSDLARFEIRERPYEFVRFDDVSLNAPHFAAYSGSEGFDHAVSSTVGRVVGVLKSTKDGAWSGNLLFAADGTRWIDPGNELAGYEYGLFDPWNRPQDTNLNILLERGPDPSPSSVPVNCNVYAAGREDGPNKEKLTVLNELQLRSPITQIPCKPTARPYLRIEISFGKGTWETFETIPVDTKMLATANHGSPGSRVLEVFFEEDGQVRVWKDEPDPVTLPTKLHPTAQQFRAIARLRDGKTVDVNFNMAGSGGSPPNERRYRGLEFIRQANGTMVQSGSKLINLNTVAAFELQVQEMKSAMVIPIHAPSN